MCVTEDKGSELHDADETREVSEDFNIKVSIVENAREIDSEEFWHVIQLCNETSRDTAIPPSQNHTKDPSIMIHDFGDVDHRI